MPSTPADRIHVTGDSLEQPSMPPGMAPEGWGVTEGGEKGEVNIKPHRKKKTGVKKPKHVYALYQPLFRSPPFGL